MIFFAIKIDFIYFNLLLPTMSKLFEIPVSSHESFDAFKEKMNWGQLIFNSNSVELQQWLTNIIQHPVLFSTLKSVLFNGFDAFTKNTSLPPQYQQFRNLHPSRSSPPSSPSDDDEDDGEMPQKKEFNLVSIGEDLNVYICQYLDLPDLIAFEKTSHCCLAAARNPSALYSMTILRRSTRCAALECQNRSIIKLSDFGVLGKYRFTNLRKLETAVELVNVRWNQLSCLKIRGMSFVLPRQNRLETLHCSYGTFLQLSEALVINPELTSLTIVFDENVPVPPTTNHNLAALQSFFLEGLYSLTWSKILKMIQSIGFIALKKLDIFVAERNENQSNTEENILKLFQCAECVSMYVNSPRQDLFPSIVWMVLANGIGCTEVNVFVNLDYVRELTQNDMDDFENCGLWSMPMWPIMPHHPKNSGKTIKFTLSILVTFPFETDPDQLHHMIQACLMKKYPNTTINAIWCEVITASNEEEQHEFDVWCEFCV